MSSRKRPAPAQRATKPSSRKAGASSRRPHGQRAAAHRAPSVAPSEEHPRRARRSEDNASERRARPRPAAKQAADRPEQRALERKRPDLSSEPHPGQFLLTTREGAEQDLIDELMLAGVVDPPPRQLAPALVLAPKVPRRDKRPIELAFARQGFPIVQSVRAHDLGQIVARVARSLRGQLERAEQYALHVWVPDSTLGNPLSTLADELENELARALAASLPDAVRVDDAALRRLGSILLAQVCLIDPERAVAGITYSNAAISLASGGRTRVRVTGAFPSRAARKLEEALAWLGVEPGPGELCVDLGAAPGGWTYVLAERRARVIAVDPAQLRPEVLAKKGVRHLADNAFTFAPTSEVDWLFCDMAWRPLEAAALLAKWGRKRWARMLVANIKLPMKKKAEIVARVRELLEQDGGWKHVRVKQLYHDRDEVTLSAHLG